MQALLVRSRSPNQVPSYTYPMLHIYASTGQVWYDACVFGTNVKSKPGLCLTGFVVLVRVHVHFSNTSD